MRTVVEWRRILALFVVEASDLAVVGGPDGVAECVEEVACGAEPVSELS